jgi:hypothetical protein
MVDSALASILSVDVPVVGQAKTAAERHVHPMKIARHQPIPDAPCVRLLGDKALRT